MKYYPFLLGCPRVTRYRVNLGELGCLHCTPGKLGVGQRIGLLYDGHPQYPSNPLAPACCTACRATGSRYCSLLPQVEGCGRADGTTDSPLLQGLLERLDEGVVIGDGGFVFALEKRGYVKAGPWTPEATVQYPEAGECPVDGGQCVRE